jgi:integrase
MLTKTAIDAAAPRAKPFIIWDDELHGFGCIIHPTGRRSLVVQYRLRGSPRSHRVALGTYGAVTVVQARKRASDVLAQARLGHDPKAEAKARRSASGVLTVATLVDAFLTAMRENRIPSHRLHGRAPSPRYVANTELHLRRFADAHGREPANAITRAQVRLFLDCYVRRPATHRMTYSALRRMFAWAIRRELITSADPTTGIEAHGPPSRERSLSLDEVCRLWRAADALIPVRRDAIRLLILTGQRRSEVAGMRWGELDLAAGTWTLPTERTKARRAHVVPLPSLAVEILRARRPGTLADADLVLPVLSRAGRLVSFDAWNWVKSIVTKSSGLQGWRWHDLRRTFVTLCAEAGGNVAVLDSILNHASSVTRAGVIGVYQRATLLEPARVVMRQWDGILREALGLPAPEDDAGNVVPLRAEAA